MSGTDTGLTRRLRGEQRWFATATPGLEGVLLTEVERLPGVSKTSRVVGGVEFSGELAVGMAANLWLRTATRVLLRLGTVHARDFSKLRRLAAKLPWRSFVDGKSPLRFEVTARSSRLYHTGAVAETLALAIEEGVGRKVMLAAPGQGDNRAEQSDQAGVADTAAAGEPAPLRIFARGEKDDWTFSVDASGELLHRRGWRTEAGEAPMRETLAAGLLALAGYDPARPLVDPMCGAGTIVIEAAAQARGLAPGQGRSFAFERWPAFEAHVWAAVRAAKTAPGAAPAGLYGFDRDPEVVAIAARNAARAGVGELVTLRQAELRGPVALDVGAGPGLVIVNPPYGRRLGQRGEAARLVRVLGHELRRRFAGWTAGILLADPAWARALGMPVRETFALSNGGLRVSYVLLDVPGARRS
jgi:putative N6-adenine-specific DNA methylase